MAKPQVIENAADKDSFVDELKPGTKLMHGQYTIESFLNAGGFGITYLARDSLDRKIVIKECFPGAFCRRSRYVVQARSRAHQNELKSIVRLFVQEARSLAKLDHPNIVGVHQVFEDNETAYMALDFVTGRDLLDTIEDPNHGLQPAQVVTILKEILGAVGFIHDQGILHRDISPDNILINKELHPVLIDFGAAREEATKQSRVLSALRVVKDGYSPQEFYIAGSDQSPSSDLYALGASFYHLIDGDVPPNSQARLAAIASGEADPYKPLAGRFPAYDDSFLAAMDKALAVLPKDRVQSARDWLQMMDGAQVNVTPLKLGTAKQVAEEVPAAVAAQAPAKKSNLPLLLGSAAVVALLVGVGAMTLTGGDDAPVAPPVASGAAAVVEDVTVAQAPAGAIAQVEAPAIAEVPAPLATSPTETEAPAVVQAPSAVEASEATPPPNDNVAPETGIATVAVAPSPVVAPVIAPEASIAEELAASIAATQTPEIAEEPAATDAEVVAAPSVVVEGPDAIDTPTPAIRPAVRPQTVELAAIPQSEPLPEPVETPRPAVDQAVDSVALATTAEGRIIANSEIAAVSLPTTPDSIESIGTGPVVEIAAVTPGNEIVPEVTTAGIQAEWTVQLPFVPAGERSNIIAAAGPISPLWVEPGLVITGVNGTNVSAIADIPATLRQLAGGGEVDSTIQVTFGTLDPASGEAKQQNWIVPVVQEVSLPDGTRFETQFSGNGWTTTVAALGMEQAGGLQLGDVITSYIPTGEAIDRRDSIARLFDREFDNGTGQFMFAVQRDGSLWVASLAAKGVTE